MFINHIKWITGILVLFFVTTNVMAQRGGGDRAEKRERIQAYRIAFMTEALELTPEESEQFWPLYNEFKEQERSIRKADKPKPAEEIEKMSDEEIEAMIVSHFESKQKILNLEQEYFEKFKDVLPIRKVAKIKPTERAFKQQLVAMMGGGNKGQRGQGGRGQHPPPDRN
jgi:hypothetical protein